MKRVIDWINLVLGVWLFIAPSSLGLSGVAATMTYLIGAAVLLVCIWALVSEETMAPEWFNIIIGAFFFLTPWLFGFTALAGGAWNAWIVGAAIAILAAVTFMKQETLTHAHAT